MMRITEYAERMEAERLTHALSDSIEYENMKSRLKELRTLCNEQQETIRVSMKVCDELAGRVDSLSVENIKLKAQLDAANIAVQFYKDRSMS